MGAVLPHSDDVPDIRYNERQVSVPVKTFRDRTVLPRVVRQVGEGVVAVAARTEALAERALRAVKVEWEVLPLCSTSTRPWPTTRRSSTRASCSARGACRSGRTWPVVARFNVETSPVGFAEADLIVERRYHTGRVYHAQMEPKGRRVSAAARRRDRAVGDAAVHSQHPPAPGADSSASR